jgi:enoyl-[acyl-carrier-protein] reductase (NADH)
VCRRQVSAAVVFLLSDSASYITGVTVAVDGAMGQSTLPLRPIEDKANLPIYGTLDPKAKL